MFMYMYTIYVCICVYSPLSANRYFPPRLCMYTYMYIICIIGSKHEAMSEGFMGTGMWPFLCVPSSPSPLPPVFCSHICFQLFKCVCLGYVWCECSLWATHTSRARYLRVRYN